MTEQLIAEQQTRFNVTKADLPLLPEESIGEFQNRLTDAVRTSIVQSLTLDPDKSHVWIEDVFEDTVVVYAEQKGPLSSTRSRLYQMSWVRKPEDDDFVFSAPKPVRRRIISEPMVDRPVTKRGDLNWRKILC